MLNFEEDKNTDTFLLSRYQKELYIVLVIFSICFSLGMAVIIKQQQMMTHYQEDLNLALKQVDARLKDIQKKENNNKGDI